MESDRFIPQRLLPYCKDYRVRRKNLFFVLAGTDNTFGSDFLYCGIEEDR